MSQRSEQSRSASDAPGHVEEAVDEGTISLGRDEAAKKESRAVLKEG